VWNQIFLYTLIHDHIWIHGFTGVDWTISKMNDSNQLMHCERFSVNFISDWVIIVGLEITHISSAQDTTVRPLITSCFSEHIYRLKHAWSWSWCASRTLRVVKSILRLSWAIGSGIHRISSLSERQIFQSYLHPTRPTWPTFRAISMPGINISTLMMFEKISARHQKSMPELSSCWFHIPQQMATELTKHGIMRWDPCCFNLNILKSPVLAWNRIVQMDCADNVILCWLTELQIMQNISWILNPHMAHAQCVQLP